MELVSLGINSIIYAQLPEFSSVLGHCHGRAEMSSSQLCHALSEGSLPAHMASLLSLGKEEEGKQQKRGLEVTENQAREQCGACDQGQGEEGENRGYAQYLYQYLPLNPSCIKNLVYFWITELSFLVFGSHFLIPTPVFMVLESDINGLLSVLEQKCILRNFLKNKLRVNLRVNFGEKLPCIAMNSLII